MMDLVIGTATLVPSLYWVAVTAATIRHFNDDNK